ncbi:MAG: ATP-binding cassette domain-containing protein [Eggerthellaceae bacterium]|nr:ATP-binding cassette domain-containing protein [Eggerthellaceae bacterium]
MKVIEARGLTKEYRGRAVVDQLSMTVNEGDIYGFVGKNGAGKSTVMKMICGLVAPTAGDITLFGSAPSAQPTARVTEAADAPAPGSAPAPRVGAPDPLAPDPARRIGVLIEEPGLLPGLTAYQNLMAKALAMGIVDAPGRCREVLRLVGLDYVERKKVRGFSLGMRQRLGLGMALLGNPDLLLLDEPFNGLDPEATRSLRNLLVHLNEVLGVTMVVSSHVLDQLDRMVTRYGVIADGRMVREMTAEQVQSECGESLLVRTGDPARTLAMLEESFPAVAFRMEPDHAIVLSGALDAEAIAQALRSSGQVILEFSPRRRDLEDYFVSLMEGRRHV